VSDYLFHNILALHFDSLAHGGLEIYQSPLHGSHLLASPTIAIYDIA